MCNHFYRIFDLWNRFDLCNDFLIFSLLSSFFTPTFWLLCFQLFLLISLPLFESSVFRYFDSYWLLSFWFIDSSVSWEFDSLVSLIFRDFDSSLSRDFYSSVWGIWTLLFEGFRLLCLSDFSSSFDNFQFTDYRFTTSSLKIWCFPTFGVLFDYFPTFRDFGAVIACSFLLSHSSTFKLRNEWHVEEEQINKGIGDR